MRPSRRLGNGHPRDHSVLIIRQMREVHEEIPALLQRIEGGDAHLDAMGRGTPAMMGGMGGMGFGGGMM